MKHKKGLSRNVEVYYHYLLERGLVVDFAEWLEHYEKDLLHTKRALDKLIKKARGSETG